LVGTKFAVLVGRNTCHQSYNQVKSPNVILIQYKANRRRTTRV